MSGKLIILLAAFFVLSGCSSIKKTTGNSPWTESATEFEIVKEIQFSSLLIPSVQIEVDIDGRNETLIATVKYSEGRWLLSVRSEDGIEIARALATNDTVMINDRLNRKVYYGEPDNLRNSYGVGTHDLSLILGIIQSGFTVVSKSDCIKELMRIEGKINGSTEIIEYNCNTKLISKVVREYKGIKEGLFISYLKFKNNNSYSFPVLIEIEIPEERINMVMRISGHQINESVNTEFIPGNNYENVLIK